MLSSDLQLWLTVAEKHLQSRSVDWSQAERFCFNEWSNPDDDELGVQIVKVSLFLFLSKLPSRAVFSNLWYAYSRGYAVGSEGLQ
jgi:hypothetical protein